MVQSQSLERSWKITLRISSFLHQRSQIQKLTQGSPFFVGSRQSNSWFSRPASTITLSVVLPQQPLTRPGHITLNFMLCLYDLVLFAKHIIFLLYNPWYLMRVIDQRICYLRAQLVRDLPFSVGLQSIRTSTNVLNMAIMVSPLIKWINGLCVGFEQNCQWVRVLMRMGCSFQTR